MSTPWVILKLSRPPPPSLSKPCPNHRAPGGGKFKPTGLDRRRKCIWGLKAKQCCKAAGPASAIQPTGCCQTPRSCSAPCSRHTTLMAAVHSRSYKGLMLLSWSGMLCFPPPRPNTRMPGGQAKETSRSQSPEKCRRLVPALNGSPTGDCLRRSAERLLRQQLVVVLSLLSHLLGAHGIGWASFCPLQGWIPLCFAPCSPSLRHSLFLPILPPLPTQPGEKLFSLPTTALSGLLFGGPACSLGKSCTCARELQPGTCSSNSHTH